MVLRRRAELAATSRADDLALRALAEIVEITSDENVRIVGGQMVSLLLAAFPVSGIAPRRTRDADTAITTELAGSGVLHDRLIDCGWVATAGNNYAVPCPSSAIQASRRRNCPSTCSCPHWTANSAHRDMAVVLSTPLRVSLRPWPPSQSR
jgi:hypothetical protein